MTCLPALLHFSNRLYQVITIKLLNEHLLNYNIRLTAKYTNSYWLSDNVNVYNILNVHVYYVRDSI